MTPIGWWQGAPDTAAFSPQELLGVLRADAGAHHVVRAPDGRVGVATGGHLVPAEPTSGDGFACLASLPSASPEDLGDPALRAVHGLRYAYLGGGMARGIGSTDLVVELARSGMMGFFGAAGLGLDRIEAAVRHLAGALGSEGAPWGVNLIHTPDDPSHEEALVQLLLEQGVRRVEAAAFMRLTPAVVRYASSGLERDAEGRVRRRNHVFAKVSRSEVARHFLAPAPEAMLTALVEAGALSSPEARLAAEVPVASALTVEADSGGHTDGRPLGPAFSSVHDLGAEFARTHGLRAPTPIGVAGGLGSPSSIASAFALGASHVLLGSVHQACVESGTSDLTREMLSKAGIADVAMTSSADMFERGIRVQVLKRGTLMPQRGNHLFGLYQRRAGLDDLEEDERTNLERSVFRASLEEVWEETQAFFQRYDPGQIALARRDPRKKMALVFRWYLGKSSQWALTGDAERRLDFQVWCGPAMGAFNDWTRGTFLAEPARRQVSVVARNLVHGAAALTRALTLRNLGVPLPAEALQYPPRELPPLR